MKKKIIVCLAVLGILGGAVAVYAGFSICPRCKRETSWFAKCQHCGTVYCCSCSSLSDQQILKGEKSYSSWCTDKCPSCGESKGKQLK